MSETAQATVTEWVTDQIKGRTSPDDPWTSRGQLRSAAREDDERDPDRVEDALDTVLERDGYFGWHGMVAPTTVPILQAIIQAEAERELPREILIGKCNRLLQEADADE